MIGLMAIPALTIWLTMTGWGLYFGALAMTAGCMSAATFWWCPPASFGWMVVSTAAYGAAFAFAPAVLTMSAFVGALFSG